MTFTPTDGADYTTAAGSVNLVVTAAPLTITADNQSMTYGGTMPSLTASYSGLVNGDTPGEPGDGPDALHRSRRLPRGQLRDCHQRPADPDYNIHCVCGTLDGRPGGHPHERGPKRRRLGLRPVGDVHGDGDAASGSDPCGTVQFEIDGSAVGSPAAVSGGTAVYTAALGMGTHSVAAVYSGNGDFAASTSAAIGETVLAAATWSGGGSGRQLDDRGQLGRRERRRQRSVAVRQFRGREHDE